MGLTPISPWVGWGPGREGTAAPEAALPRNRHVGPSRIVWGSGDRTGWKGGQAVPADAAGGLGTLGGGILGGKLEFSLQETEVLAKAQGTHTHTGFFRKMWGRSQSEDPSEPRKPLRWAEVPRW